LPNARQAEINRNAPLPKSTELKSMMHQIANLPNKMLPSRCGSDLDKAPLEQNIKTRS
jgi:hypothetical protein